MLVVETTHAGLPIGDQSRFDGAVTLVATPGQVRAAQQRNNVEERIRAWLRTRSCKAKSASDVRGPLSPSEVRPASNRDARFSNA